MNEENLLIASFCRLLARVRKMFRELHIHAEKQPCFNGVTTTVSHDEKDLMDSQKRTNAVEVSFSLDSDLKEVKDGDKHSLGVSIAIYFADNEWRIEGDVGWSCYELGWDDIDHFETVARTPHELEDVLEEFVAQTLGRYKIAVEELTP